MASPNSTLPKTPEEQDKLYNPGEQASLEKMGAGYVSSGTDQLESFANDPNNASKEVNDKEESPEQSPPASWENKTSGSQKGSRWQAFGTFVKKRGAIFGISGLLIGGGIGVSIFSGPTLLLVQFKEVMVDKFDTGLAFREARTGKLMKAQIDGATTGFCSKGLTIRCKMTTLSADQVADLKGASITVEPETPNIKDKGGEVTRTKPTAYIFKGKRITAAEFASQSGPRTEFGKALRLAYNPKTGGFNGNAFRSVMERYGFSRKSANLSGNNNEERMKKLDALAKNGATGAATPKVAADFEELCEGSTDPCDPQERADKYNATLTDIDEDSASGRAAKNASSILGDIPLKGIVSGTKITGIVDNYCTAYGAINALGYAAKTIRAIQLVRYASAFVNVADEIKATGNVSPETAGFMAGILTEVTIDATSTTRRIIKGSATDSLGYKFAAYGDTSANKNSMNIASRYLAGGGFTGELIEFSNIIANNFPGGRKQASEVCGVLANPIVQGASIAVGLAALLVPGANVGKTIANAASSIVINAGLAVLPALLGDIVAGTVTSSITGEESGNAITSGMGKMLADGLAGLSGGALMSKPDALSYAGLQNQTIAAYAESDRETLSPLDASSRYTFLGSIVSNLIPTINTASQSGVGLLSSLTGVFSTSLNSVVPKTQALTTEQYEKSLEVCQDIDVRDGKYATDIFCNVIRGIPPKYLNKDPILVVDELIRDGYLEESSEEPTQKYKDFISNCITSEESPGYGGATGLYEQAKVDECIITDANANQYLNYADREVESVMSGDAAKQTSGSLDVSGDKASLAKQIINSPNVTYNNGDNPGFDIKDQIANIANGTSDGNTAPCQVNIHILKVIAALAQSHSLVISDINRDCVQSNIGSASSPHRTGLAVDIATYDGGLNTASPQITELLDIVVTVMPEGSDIGIVGGCNAVGSSYKGFAIFDDPGACGHLHLAAPKGSDPDYKS